jgi:hypothetical protein
MPLLLAALIVSALIILHGYVTGPKGKARK